MSIHAINKSTDKYSGGGLPVYDKLDYIFSKLNNKFNSDIGLYGIPSKKTPSFQIFVPEDTVVSFVYHETKGGNEFTGVTFSVGVSSINVFAGQKNGVPGYWMHTNQDGNLVTPAPEGRWVGFLTVKLGLGEEVIYYTEEFLTCAKLYG